MSLWPKAQPRVPSRSPSIRPFRDPSAGPLERAIRVVLFSGAYLEPNVLRFAVLLERHPEIDLAHVFCEAPGTGWGFRLRELWLRRRWLAGLVLAREAFAAILRGIRSPAVEWTARSVARRVQAKLTTVPDVHAEEALQAVRALQPDLALIYGAPLLRPALYEIPAFGTLGIHHGRVPDYRGKKTTFWEMYNGEPTAGVTIQRVNAGIDTGDIVKSGVVRVGSKSYGRVEREIIELGWRLYLDAVLDVRDGRAELTPQPASASIRHYRDPGVRDLVALWLRGARKRLKLRRI